MRESKVQQIERFLLSPLACLASAFVLGGVGMKYQEHGTPLIVLGCLFAVVAVLRHCHVSKMTALQIVAWTGTALFAALLSLSYTIWRPKIVAEDRAHAAQGSLITFNPNKYLVRVGMNQRLELTVRNDHDYPLYFVQIQVTTVSGDISSDDVFVNVYGKEGLPDRRPGPTGEGEFVRVIFPTGNVRAVALGINYYNTKTRHNYSAYFLSRLDGHSSQSFPVFIQTDRMTKDSEITFSLRGSFKEPAPIFYGGPETVSYVPPEGNFERMDIPPTKATDPRDAPKQNAP